MFDVAIDNVDLAALKFRNTQAGSNLDDVFGYFISEYKKDNKDKDFSTVSAEEFIEYSRKLFAKNPPVGVDYSLPGLAVILQDMTKLPFLISKDHVNDYNLYEPEVAVTAMNRR
jgi:hypothetical protein